VKLFDRIRKAAQQTASPQPAGDPIECARLREAAYRELFEGDPIRVLSHEAFGKPDGGGRIEVRVYELEVEGETERVQVAVTSGLSDYRMGQVEDGVARHYRREVIQYFGCCGAEELNRMHGVAWVALASGFALDFFQTVSPLPGEWSGSLFLPSLVTSHAEWTLPIEGEQVQLLWQVPLRQAELDLARERGVDAVLDRMEAVGLPWIFDAGNRPSLT
jgi:hypothetical protein